MRGVHSFHGWTPHSNPPRTTGSLLATIMFAPAGCGEMSTLPVAAYFGPQPSVPKPHQSLVPTVNIAPEKVWPIGAMPVPAARTRVAAFASGLDHSCWLYVLPNGDVPVAETNAAPKPSDRDGIKRWTTRLVMKGAGAATPSANRIPLLRDTDGDGVFDRTALLPARLSDLTPIHDGTDSS